MEPAWTLSGKGYVADLGVFKSQLLLLIQEGKSAKFKLYQL